MEKRITDRLVRRGECLEWTGATRNGYGVVSCGPPHRMHYVHRLAWADHHGEPVPEGAHVHHACDNRLCSNPLHLIAMTPLEHAQTRRGRGPVDRSHCSQGHQLTAENTYTRAGTRQRECKRCRADAVQRYKQRALA